MHSLQGHYQSYVPAPSGSVIFKIRDTINSLTEAHKPGPKTPPKSKQKTRQFEAQRFPTDFSSQFSTHSNLSPCTFPRFLPPLQRSRAPRQSCCRKVYILLSESCNTWAARRAPCWGSLCCVYMRDAGHSTRWLVGRRNCPWLCRTGAKKKNVSHVKGQT